MPQRHRHDVSQNIAKGNIASAMPPRMVWDEHTLSLNQSDPTADGALGEDEYALRDLMMRRHALIHRAMMILTPKELAVIHRHYGFYTGEPMDLRMCAEDLNVTYNAVQKRHNVAMRKLARFLKVPYRKRPGKWWTGSEGYGW